MRGNRSRDTKPELAMRKALREAGEPGYRLHWKLPGKPDIVYPGRRVAVFVNGCYWHGCPRCAKKPARTNADYWMAKIAYNQGRDAANHAALTKDGWQVVVVWECETKKSLTEAVSSVLAALIPDTRRNEV